MQTGMNELGPPVVHYMPKKVEKLIATRLHTMYFFFFLQRKALSKTNGIYIIESASIGNMIEFSLKSYLVRCVCN